MTLEDFANGIEAALRNMQAEQARLFESAIAADLNPELLVGIMSAILARVEREAEAAQA